MIIQRQNGKTVKWETAQKMMVDAFVEHHELEDEKRIQIVKKLVKEYLEKGT